MTESRGTAGERPGCLSRAQGERSRGTGTSTIPVVGTHPGRCGSSGSSSGSLWLPRRSSQTRRPKPESTGSGKVRLT